MYIKERGGGGGGGFLMMYEDYLWTLSTQSDSLTVNVELRALFCVKQIFLNDDFMICVSAKRRSESREDDE